MVRRHLTTTLTMLALIGILVFATLWGWNAMIGGGADSDASDEPTCTTEVIEAGGKIRARQVTVSVFNGGTRSGQAGRTLDALTARGFQAGTTDNAPSDVDVRKVQVWSVVENDPRARLVARQFGKGVKVQFSDEDLGPGVDVIVGNKFRKLEKAPRTLKVSETQEFCFPVESEAPQL